MTQRLLSAYIGMRQSTGGCQALSTSSFKICLANNGVGRVCALSRAVVGVQTKQGLSGKMCKVGGIESHVRPVESSMHASRWRSPRAACPHFITLQVLQEILELPWQPAS